MVTVAMPSTVFLLQRYLFQRLETAQQVLAEGQRSIVGRL